MELVLVTMSGVVFSGKASKVTIPTTSGQITVLPKHTPLISQISPGLLTAHTEEGKKEFTIGPGVLEVRRNGWVVALIESAV